MRISARNQLSGIVEKLNTGDVMIVTVIVKSTEVMLGVEDAR